VRLRWEGWTTLLVFLPLSSAWAQRLPVLRQIDVPHPYYYREMYLPELTTGPSSVAWAPVPSFPGASSVVAGATAARPTTSDARFQDDLLIFSMQGCLWRQRLGQDVAEQLTDGPGYDYQPDVSPDGRWVIYSKYDEDAIELWLLDLSTGKPAALTSNGAVNVEARWSPAFNAGDTRVVFVSTQFNRHFHIFVARFDAAKQQLGPLQRISGETRSSLPRYYYSPYDHELSPTWSPDGQEIIFISNRGHIHGSGGMWRMAVPATVTAAPPARGPMARGPFARMQRAPAEVFGADAREIRYEETTWKARPDWSPDGKRVVYSSYLGGQWHQIWVMPANGGDVFPLSYGDYDNTMPRWSPDGKRIAFISNRGGGTSLWIRDWLGGRQTQVIARQLRWLHPHQRLTLAVLDELGHAAAARISVVGSDGRAYAPAPAWMHTDDNFVRSERRYEEHYFHSAGGATLQVPAGHYQIEVTHGLEYKPQHLELDVSAGRAATAMVRLKPLPPFPAPDATTRWLSGDVHVHMNYAGTYRATPQTLIAQMHGENLTIVHDLIVNKEQRFPDIEYAGRMGKIDPASAGGAILTYGQEFHTSYWGHLGLLGLTNNLLIPGYAGYPNTIAASIFPSNAMVADLAHAQSPTALAGYVHPFDAVPAPDRDASITDELPVDIALGKVDYYEVLGFSDHKSSAAVWYKLLNLGFRIPAAAGTDAMSNFATLRGPVGLNRVYVQMPSGAALAPSQTLNSWMAGLKRGQTFATNGPLLRFSLGGQTAGGEVKIPNSQTVKFRAGLRSIVPVDHLEIVCNGAVAISVPLNSSRDAADASGGLNLSRSGWCVLRAWAEKSEYPVLDDYPYATTGAIYVRVAGQPARSPESAKYFMAWIDRLIANAQTHPGYNSDAEKQAVLDELNAARKIYAGLSGEAK
jgi:hypothetical protein